MGEAAGAYELVERAARHVKQLRCLIRVKQGLCKQLIGHGLSPAMSEAVHLLRRVADSLEIGVSIPALSNEIARCIGCRRPRDVDQVKLPESHTGDDLGSRGSRVASLRGTSSATRLEADAAPNFRLALR